MHASWRGALLPVDLIVDEPLSAAPCVALLCGGVHVDDDWRLLVNCGMSRAYLFQVHWGIRLLLSTNAAVAGNTPRPPSTCRTAATNIG